VKAKPLRCHADSRRTDASYTPIKNLESFINIIIYKRRYRCYVLKEFYSKQSKEQPRKFTVNIWKAISNIELGNCAKWNSDSLHINYSCIPQTVCTSPWKTSLSPLQVFCASSKITVRNYSDKHITIKLIKGKGKKSQLEAGECVYICEVESWAELYM
jgi:hypothetical protein